MIREIYMELWNGRKEKVILLTVEEDGSGRNREVRHPSPAAFSNSSSPPD